jgi:group II intron reverse transcriptase/maturase
MRFTENLEATEAKLNRIAMLSKANPKMVFANVIHHFNKESLTACYHALNGKKALGSDGIDKAKYGENLEANLEDLMGRMKRMAYIPGAVRQVLIPKEGRPGATRPLGISNFEDKLVQKMMQKILESIYEPLFYENSYGFRPGRSCHGAIKVLHTHLSTYQVETVIDVDLCNFFSSIDHEAVMKVIEKKISDPRLLRYLRRMFKAGVLAEGELITSEEGVPQGSVCSPIIANIFAHEVIDEWLEKTVKHYCLGEVKAIRYADDLVICCQYHRDAERIKVALGHRLAKYGLKMNNEKTKLVRFSIRKKKRGEAQETFDFLGFTFYIGRSLKGILLVKVKISGKRLRLKLKKVNDWARSIRNKIKLGEVIKLAISKLRGHVQYYGVSHNYGYVRIFIDRVKIILFKWLNRRSQRKSFNWEIFMKYLDRYKFPKAKICHPLF